MIVPFIGRRNIWRRQVGYNNNFLERIPGMHILVVLKNTSTSSSLSKRSGTLGTMEIHATPPGSSS